MSDRSDCKWCSYSYAKGKYLRHGQHKREQSKRSFSDGFVSEILALLDRIEIEDDNSLTRQRFDIVEKYGMTVVIG